MHEPFGTVVNAETQPKKTGHYDGVQNAVTSMKGTGQNTNPENAGAGTTTKGPTPTP
jgi:hypothetical protein